MIVRVWQQAMAGGHRARLGRRRRRPRNRRGCDRGPPAARPSSPTPICRPAPIASFRRWQRVPIRPVRLRHHRQSAGRPARRSIRAMSQSLVAKTFRPSPAAPGHRDPGGARSTTPPTATTPAVVKPVVAWDAGGKRGYALYFTRATRAFGRRSRLYHHIGIYAFTRAALARFVALPPSPLEKREKLEQLRALEAGVDHRGRARGQRCRSASTLRPISKKRADC